MKWRLRDTIPRIILLISLLLVWLITILINRNP